MPKRRFAKITQFQFVASIKIKGTGRPIIHPIIRRFFLPYFFAPYVKESTVQIGMEFKTKMNIPINNTLMIIGQIKSISLPEKAISTDGYIDLEITKTITNSGLDSYHRTERIVRLPYAKPLLL